MRKATTVLESEQAKDRAATLRNRARLGANKNLLFWYREPIISRPCHITPFS
jgi:hypothetical protein